MGIGTGTRLAELAVLAVDDHEINRRFIASALRARVATLVVVGNGHEALRQFRDQRFDVVLMDIHMPDMDGVSTWRAMRAERDDASIRVLALTADRRIEESERLRAAGFHGFLSKPVGVKLLLEALQRAATGAEEFVSFEQAGPRRTALLDPDQAAAAAGGTERARELFQGFLPELESAQQQLETLLAARRFDEAAASVHRLRGAAGYVGAARLQDACRRLENSLRRELDSSPGTLLVDLIRVIEGTRAALLRELEVA